MSIRGYIIQSLRNAIVFGSLWAAWAYFANSDHGADSAFRASITQGTFSFVMTFFFSSFVQYMYTLGKTNLIRYAYGFVIPNIMLVFVSSSIHYWRGTPDIAQTIAPAIVAALIFCFLYVRTNNEKRRSEEVSEPSETIAR